MPRSGPNGTYTLPGAQDEAQPNTTIQSSINNQGWADIEQTFNTPQPVAYGGTGATDAQGAVSAFFDGTTYVLDDNLRIAASGDTSKLVKLDLSDLSTATTRTLTVPNANGTIALTSDLASAVPPGATLPFARNSAPSGWLKANGAAVSRSSYAALFAAIGTTFGAGDGSTTFNLPDLRGEFVRGWDDGRGVDSGRAFGSAQSDQNAKHSHAGTAASAGAHTHPGSSNSTGAHNHEPGDASASFMSVGGASQGTNFANAGGMNYRLDGITTTAGKHSHTITVSSAGAHTHSLSIDNQGGNEARPRNCALLYCIKY